MSNILQVSVCFLIFPGFNIKIVIQRSYLLYLYTNQVLASFKILEIMDVLEDPSLKLTCPLRATWKIMVKLRTSNNALMCELGRHYDLPCTARLCQICNSDDAESKGAPHK